MNIVEAIVARLKNYPEVSAIVQGKVATLVAPQSWDGPFVVISFPSSNPDHALEGPSGYVETLVQVDCYGPKSDAGMAQALDLSKAVRVALEPWRGTLAGVEVQGIEMQNQFPEYDEELRQRRVVQTYLVMHGEDQ